MSVSKNLYPVSFLRRYAGAFFIFSAVLLIFWLYNDHYNVRKFFKFPVKGTVEKSVNEKGKIVFSSGRELLIENTYTSFETVKSTGSIIKIKGKVQGDIDPVLKTFIKENDYSMELDTSASFPVGAEKFLIQYPTVFRRFVYYMPRNSLFNGQEWMISAFGGTFSCNYKLTLEKKKSGIDLQCLGNVEKTGVTVTGALVLNKELDGFKTVDLEITAQSDEMTSTWKFSETAKNK